MLKHSTDGEANVDDESSTPEAPALVQKDGWGFCPYYFCADWLEPRRRGEREETGKRLCTLRHPQQSRREEEQQVDVIRRPEGDYVCVHSLCTFINAGESTSLALRNLYMQGISNFVRTIPASVVRLSELHQCLKALVRALDRNLQDVEEEAGDLPSTSQLEHVKSFQRRAKALDDLWDSLVVRGDTSAATSAVSQRAGSFSVIRRCCLAGTDDAPNKFHSSWGWLASSRGRRRGGGDVLPGLFELGSRPLGQCCC